MQSVPSDHLGAVAWSPIGGQPLLLLDAAHSHSYLPEGAVVVAVDYAGALPAIGTQRFDALVTSSRDAPRPWVSVAPERLAAQLDIMRAKVAAAPIAASVLARILRINEHLPFDDALEVE